MSENSLILEEITPFGEIYYASKAFYALSLDKVINGTLGVRSSTYNGYQWDEIMSAMSDVFLCGSDCVENVNRSECHLRESPEIRIPTSHTIGRAIKEISHEDMEYGKSEELSVTERIWKALEELVTEIVQCFGIEDENIFELLVNRTDKLNHFVQFYQLRNTS